MPPVSDGSAGRRRSAAVLRGLGVLVALALAGTGAWLIVTGKTQKRIEIGVLLGLWGALVGAYSMFTRHRATAPPVEGRELELRSAGAVEGPAEADARRQWEYRLEQMLRHQIQATMAAEVQGLRVEIAALRSDLMDKLGGQVQLERIDITRVIGSDLEALQQEVRQLKSARDHGALARLTGDPAGSDRGVIVAEQVVAEHVVGEQVVTGQLVTEAPAGGESLVTAEALVTPQAVVTLDAPAPAAPVTAEAVVTAEMPVLADASVAPIMAPTPAAPLTAEVAPSSAVDSGPQPVAAGAGDPFAAMPRLTRFTDFDLEPAQSAPTPAPANGHDADGAVPAAPDAGEVPQPAADDAAPVQRRGGGRHALSDLPRSGGRRRRRSDAVDDVLARVLQREGVL